MSTKNLARTVIEGGRGRFSRAVRRLSHHVARAVAREAIEAARRTDRLDELVVPLGSYGGTTFHDKLGPARRWLASQAGRPWDLVRKDLSQRFDTRTTAGRHIVHCHLLREVEPQWPHWRPEFHIDARGILRHRVWPRRQPRLQLPRPACELVRWLAGRRVGERGEALFWFVPTESGAFRQHHRFDEADARLWRSIPRCFQKHHRALPSPPRN